MYRLRNQQGLTLIELLLSVTLLAIIMTGVFSFLIHCSSLWQQGHRAIDVQESLAVGMDKMARELRTCDRLTFTNASAGFRPEIDGSVLCLIINNQQTRYFVDHQNELSRHFSGVGLPVSSHVKGMGLEYYDREGNHITPGAPAAEVVRVKINITGAARGMEDITLSTAVSIRTANW